MTESPQSESLRIHGRSFYWAKHLLGASHSGKATRLYAFCREVDDLADRATSKAIAKEKLAEVVCCLESGNVREPWLIDAMLLFRASRIPLWVPRALVQGVLWDLDAGLIENEGALLRYCFQVAGTVGLMMSGVLDVTDPDALPHAVDLGIAMQLTNIARDVAKDAEMGRRYLPGAWVGGLGPEHLIAPSIEHEAMLKAAVRRLLALAEAYYQSGIQGISYLPANARLSILVAAKLYREIGVEILKRDGNSWREHVHVPMSRKRELTLAALGFPILNRAYWHPRAAHNSALHRALGEFPLNQGLLL